MRWEHRKRGHLTDTGGAGEEGTGTGFPKEISAELSAVKQESVEQGSGVDAKPSVCIVVIETQRPAWKCSARLELRVRSWGTGDR